MLWISFIYLHVLIKQKPKSRQTTQDQWLWLTAVSVFSCRGERGRKSHPCRSGVSSTGHSTQQHLHLLSSWRWQGERPPAWTLALDIKRREKDWMCESHQTERFLCHNYTSVSLSCPFVFSFFLVNQGYTVHLIQASDGYNWIQCPSVHTHLTTASSNYAHTESEHISASPPFALIPCTDLKVLVLYFYLSLSKHTPYAFQASNQKYFSKNYTKDRKCSC